MNLRLVGEKILVKQKVVSMTESGLLMPVLGLLNRGEVIKVGNFIPESTGCKDIQEGDVIMWNEHAGMGIEYDGEKYLVIRPNDVIGIIK